MTPALMLKDVTKTYPGEPPVQSLRGVSFQVLPGELVAITGPSGSGKRQIGLRDGLVVTDRKVV